jgi:transcriptional regulator with PAS, ATPase and Fis domain
MANSFLQRLFGQKKRGSEAGSLTFSETLKNLVNPQTRSRDVADQEDRNPLEFGPAVENTGVTTNVNSLFAFVDPKDPFTAGEIAGKELPGPILSIMSAKQFGSLFLFHTPQVHGNALATKTEVSRRYPTCSVLVYELHISDPKNYSLLMGQLGPLVRNLMLGAHIGDIYVCVSSGTAEMRAAWFLLTALGVLPAKLLQVGTPARPLFGKANVKEVQIDSRDWQTIWDLAMPAEFFSDSLGVGAKSHREPESMAGRRWPQWEKKGTPTEDAAAKLEEKPKTGEETFGFDETFVERMRMHGDALPELLLPRLREKIRRNEAFATVFSPDEIRDFAQDVFRKFAEALRREGRTDQPERFGALADSICNDVLLDYYRSSAETVSSNSYVDSEGQEVHVMGELRLTRKQVEALRRAKEPLRDEAAEKELPEEAKAVAEQVPTETGEYEIMSGEPAIQETLSSLVARETPPIPGLDDALRELGIFIGSAALRHAAEQAGIAAGSHLPILLLGETGTGKERFAHLIHRLSPRFHRELVPVNCAAIPASLAESYLLGHVKGAFTGATSDAKGIFEAANQSTLFLDEIAELTLEVQAKLLRVIQDGVVQRVGSTAPHKVDVRIIAASNRDLRKEVSAGRFREDLYFRLEVVQIKLPALRERLGEIPELALMLLRQINQLREKPRQLTTEALARLERQPWPGNVRDLLNVLERSVLYSRAEVIDAEDLKFNCDPPGKDPFVALPELSDGFKLEKYLAQVRNQLFLQALEACKGNQTAAAEMLGVSKQAVSKFVQGQNDNEN